MINSKILVSRTVNGCIGVVPTQVTFEQVSTNERVATFTAPIQSSDYVIYLPNKQFYALSVKWESADGSSGTNYFIQPFYVDAGVGVTSTNGSISWEDYSQGE